MRVAMRMNSDGNYLVQTTSYSNEGRCLAVVGTMISVKRRVRRIRLKPPKK